MMGDGKRAEQVWRINSTYRRMHGVLGGFLDLEVATSSIAIIAWRFFAPNLETSNFNGGR